MCSTGPFQYRWMKGYIYSSCYYHHQLGSIHLFHCYHIFPWLCAWDVCYIINREFVFIIIVQFMISAYSRLRFILQIVLVCLYSTPSHYHHRARLSEVIELIKCLSDKYLSSVWVRLNISSQLSIIQFIIQYVGCVFSVYPLPLSWLREYIYFVLLSSNRKYELLPIVYG